MHEQSETIQRPGGWANVYGDTQFPLPKTFGFEKKGYYPSLSQAEVAAQWRSRMGGGPEDAMSSAPQYGFGAMSTPAPPPVSSLAGPAEQIQRMNSLLDMRRGR